MPASLNDIYRLVGELIATSKSTNDRLDGLARDLSEFEDRSADSRANVHRRLDEVLMRTNNLEADVASVKGRFDRVEAVSADVVALRLKAAGAGTLGQWLIRIGLGVVGFAGWLVGIYTWLTGRPPP